MPIYDYKCSRCNRWHQAMRSIAQRRRGPKCCGVPAALQISPVRGVVKNPAVPRSSK